MVLRARRGERTAALEEAAGGARGRPPERAARRARRPRRRARRVVGRIAVAQPRVSLLHVPRQHHRAADPRRQRRVEDVHDSAQPRRRPARPPAGTPTFGPSGVGVWGVADARSETAPAVRHHRQQLLAAGHDDQRCDHGARPRLGRDRLVEAGAAERRLQLGVLDDAEGADVPGGERAGLRLRIAGHPRERRPAGASCCWPDRSQASSGRSIPTRTAKSCGRRASARAASTAACSGAWPATASTSTPRRRTPSIDADGDRADLDPKAGGGLTALRIADGSTVWRAEPPPCTDRPNCSPAQSAALTAIPGVRVLGFARRPPARLFDA